MEEISKKRIGVIGAETPTDINRLLAAADLGGEAGLLYTKEAEYQMEMIKMYDEFQYSHLTRKEREADIKPIRNSNTDPKIGRNDSCPCGSGKKYKRCCFSCR